MSKPKTLKEFRDINNEMDKKLTGEYNRIMTDIIAYLRFSRLNDCNVEAIRQDLIEMFLSAQCRNENIKTVIGEDYKVFCDEIIANAEQMSFKEKLLEKIEYFFMIVYIVGMINTVFSKFTVEFVKNFWNQDKLNFIYILKTDVVITSIFIVFNIYLFINVFIKNTFKDGGKYSLSTKKSFFIAWGYFSIITAIMIVIKYIWDDIKLFSIHIVGVLIFILIAFLISKILGKYNEKLAINKYLLPTKK